MNFRTSNFSRAPLIFSGGDILLKVSRYLSPVYLLSGLDLNLLTCMTPSSWRCPHNSFSEYFSHLLASTVPLQVLSLGWGVVLTFSPATLFQFLDMFVLRCTFTFDQKGSVPEKSTSLRESLALHCNILSHLKDSSVFHSFVFFE